MNPLESKESIQTTIELPLSSFVPRRYKPGNTGNWSGHLAFANDLIAATKPSLLVELGTHYGESYFGFCQSVAEHHIDCLCYAVDTWLGEAHAGYYTHEVFEEVSKYNETFYGDFSYLLRCTFDEAIPQFLDESIDLLHIDGLHTYEAIGHDFHAWMPKVRPGGIILLHDVAVRHADFGVWRLWDEIKLQFPDSFAFHHSWGLGVLRKPGGMRLDQPDLLKLLFSSPVSVQERIRRHYSIYSSHLENVLRAQAIVTTVAADPEVASAAAAPTTVTENADCSPELAHEPTADSIRTCTRIYPYGATGYSEKTSLGRDVDFGQSANLSFDLDQGIGNGCLRIDPADCPCIIELFDLSIKSKSSGRVLWTSHGDDRALNTLTTSGTAMPLPYQGQFLIVSDGTDPQLKLPHLENLNEPITVEISLRNSKLHVWISETLDALSRDKQEAVDRAVAVVHSEMASVRFELQTSRAERMLVTSELKQIASERNETERELKTVRDALESAERQIQEGLEQKILLDTLNSQLADAQKALAQEQAIRQGLQNSVSWRVTQPARDFLRAMRALLGRHVN